MRLDSDTLRAGDEAPDFTLTNQRDEEVSLGALLADGPALLAFHRGTW